MSVYDWKANVYALVNGVPTLLTNEGSKTDWYYVYSPLGKGEYMVIDNRYEDTSSQHGKVIISEEGYKWEHIEYSLIPKELKAFALLF